MLLKCMPGKTGCRCKSDRYKMAMLQQGLHKDTECLNKFVQFAMIEIILQSTGSISGVCSNTHDVCISIW